MEAYKKQEGALQFGLLDHILHLCTTCIGLVIIIKLEDTHVKNGVSEPCGFT